MHAIFRDTGSFPRSSASFAATRSAQMVHTITLPVGSLSGLLVKFLRLPRFMKVLTAVRKRLLFKNEVGIQEINQPSRLVTPFAAGSPAHQVPFSYKLKRSRSSLLLCRYIVRASEPALVTVQPKPERGISFQSLTAWHFQRSPELVINSLDTRCIELLLASQHTNHGLANAASSDH